MASQIGGLGGLINRRPEQDAPRIAPGTLIVTGEQGDGPNTNDCCAHVS